MAGTWSWVGDAVLNIFKLFGLVRANMYELGGYMNECEEKIV